MCGNLAETINKMSVNCTYLFSLGKKGESLITFSVTHKGHDDCSAFFIGWIQQVTTSSVEFEKG